MSDPSSGPAGSRPDWRQMRREEKRARRGERHEMSWWTSGWIAGLVLIGLGVLFLLRNFGVPLPDNWWTVFLVLPGLGALWTAWRMYQHEGRLSRAATGSAVAGCLLLVLGISFFFGFDWGNLWPLILIALGVVIVFSGGRRG
jgi:hypothetical protein